MFEELMHSIWEEFSKLVFHAEVEVEPGQAEGVFAGNGGGNEPTALDYSGGTLEGQPSALQQVAAQGGLAGGPERRRNGRGGARQRRPGAGRDRGQRRARQNRPQRPLLVRQREEVQEVPRRLRASACTPMRLHDPSESSSAPSTSAISTRSSPSSTPRSSCTRCGGCARAWRRRGSGRRGRRAGVQQTIELEQLYEDEAAGDGTRGRADRAPLALGRGRLGGRRSTRWPGSSSCATTGSVGWRPFEDRAEAMRAAGFRTALDFR